MFHDHENLYFYLFKFEMMKKHFLKLFFYNYSLNISIINFYLIYITIFYKQDNICSLFG